MNQLESDSKKFLEDISRNIEWEVVAETDALDCVLMVQGTAGENIVRCQTRYFPTTPELTDEIKRFLLLVLDYCVRDISKSVFLSDEYQACWESLFDEQPS